jgi:hypothetical protein
LQVPTPVLQEPSPAHLNNPRPPEPELQVQVLGPDRQSPAISGSLQKPPPVHRPRPP